MTVYIVPGVVVVMLIVCAVKKIAVYDCFIDGAKGAWDIVKTILPYITAIFICISLFKASGLSRALAKLLSYPLNYLGIPPELTELLFLIPLSGNGTIALLNEIITQYGPDNYITRCASVICGSTETIFYISAVYFSQCKVKKLRYGIPVAIVSTLSSAIIACALCRFM